MIRETLTVNTGSTLLPCPAPVRQIGHARIVPDVTRTQESLTLSLSFDLSAALRRTLQWNAL